MRSDLVETALDKLSALRAERDRARAAQELRAALGNRVNLVVARAAKIAGELRAMELVPDLVTAYSRLMANAPKLDKACAAVTQIATTLYDLDYLEPEPYLAGIRHVQMEGSYGPPVDTAARLRAQCALGLVRNRHPEALSAVVGLLVDREPQARIGAVRALGTINGDISALLLRLKVLTGDAAPEVIAECFYQLLAVAPESSLEFVAGHMESDDPAIAEAAVLALGGCRQPKALALLREKFERTATGPLRKVILVAFAMARMEEATEYLLSLLLTAHSQTAVDIIASLAEYQNNERIRHEVERIIAERNERALVEAFQRGFVR